MSVRAEEKGASMIDNGTPNYKGTAIMLREMARLCLQWASVFDLEFPLPHSGKDGGTQDRKSTRLNSSHIQKSRMPSSA